MNDTTGGSLRLMRSAFEDVAIVIGNLFSPSIRMLAGGLSGGAKVVFGFMEKFPVLSRVVAMAAGGTLLLAMTTKTLAFGLHLR